MVHIALVVVQIYFTRILTRTWSKFVISEIKFGIGSTTHNFCPELCVRLINGLYIQFDNQDVMVPWHLQPKYKGHVERATKEPKTRARKHKKGKRKESRGKEKTGKEVEYQGLMPDTGMKEETEPHEECEVDDLFLKDLSLDAEDFFPSRTQLSPTQCSSPSHCEHLDQDGKTRNKHVARSGAELEVEVAASDRMAESKENLPRHSGEKSEGVPKSLEEQGYATYQRYYHVFKAGELASLVEGVPELKVKQEFYDHENWCVVAIKTK